MPERHENDWAAVRALFPVTKNRVYVNTASYGPGPTPVVEAVERELAAWTTGEGVWRDWEDRSMEARGLFARLLGREAREVALVSSLSSAAAQVAESLPIPTGSTGGARPNLVLGADEFRSNLFPWMKQARRGFETRLVPFDGGRLRADDVIAAMDANTALVAVSHVQSANGYRIDLATLGEACRERGARLFVDATQSLGATPVPLVGVDYLAVAAYKWLLAPRGCAFLWIAPARLDEQVPLAPSWKTPAEPYVDYYGGPYEPERDVRGPAGAACLDASLAWPVWQGGTRALQLLLDVGLDAITVRNHALAERFREGLPALGLEGLFDGEERSPIVALRVPDPERVKANLAGENVVAAVRSSYLRTSFHFFNDEDDVDRVLASL